MGSWAFLASPPHLAAAVLVVLAVVLDLADVDAEHPAGECACQPIAIWVQQPAMPFGASNADTSARNAANTRPLMTSPARIIWITSLPVFQWPCGVT